MGIRSIFSRRKDRDDGWALPDDYGGSVSIGANTLPHDRFDWADDDDPRGDAFRYSHTRESEGRWWQRRFWFGRRKRWWAVRIVVAALLTFMLLAAYLAITAPLSKSLHPIVPPQLTLLAADGTPIARNGAMVEQPVDVTDLPPHVIQAFMAIEDRRFYSHWGIDPRGIARATFTGVGGGSTITQQLAKFTFLTPERTLTRKAREALIAFWLEAWLTKDEILGRYLSNAYFGDNVYGLRAASLHYFYRQPEKLRPEQAAMLAGLVQAPSAYAPTRHWDRAMARMAMVKNAMVDAGYLTQAEVAAMRDPVLDVRTKRDVPTGTYFADWALPQARKLTQGGYDRQTLTTTLDSRLQNLARRIVERAPLNGAQAALVAMRPNGEVVAMVGGTDYGTSAFNRVTQAKRQTGSTFKLFVYLAALAAGAEPDDRIDNTEITEGAYRPRNYADRYSGTLTLEQAFAQSSNVAAVRLLNDVGSEQVIDMARKLGVTSPMTEGDPSLALGTSTMTLLELTAAYAGVAGNDYPVVPRAFAAEERGWFDWLRDPRGEFYGSDLNAMEQLLRAAINTGTGRAATLSGPNFGKTGTTQNNRDALFVGYAGEGDDRLVVGVWIGNDDNSPLGRVTGGGLPAQMWRDFMVGAKMGSVPAADAPREADDPGGPVEPLDVPELDDIPLGDDASMGVDENGVTIRSDVEGVPLDLRIDRDGVRVNPGQREPAPRDAPREVEPGRLEEELER